MAQTILDTAPWRLGAPRYHVLWPLALVVLVDGVAAGWILAIDPPLTQRVSLVVALSTLLTGIMLALLRPSMATTLFGCYAVLMAASLGLLPAEVSTPHPPLFLFLMQQNVPLATTLRLTNGVLLAPLLLHLTLYYPRAIGHPRWLMPCVYAATLIMLGLVIVSPPAAQRLGCAIALIILLLMLLGYAAYNLIDATRAATAAQQHMAQQARLLLLSLVLSLSPIVLRIVGRVIEVEINTDIILLTQLCFPGAVAYTILRHDLFGIDSALRRAMGYTLVSVALVAVYFGLTAALTRLLGQISPPFRIATTIMVLFAAAAVFSPLQQRAQEWIDRTFYPERQIFLHAIDATRAQLTLVVSRAEIERLLVRDLPQQIGALRAHLGAGQAGAQQRYEHGWHTELRIGGEVLAHYDLDRRASGTSYTEQELQQLDALSQQAALAMAYAATIEELAALNDDLEERVATRSAQLLAQQRALVAQDERQRIARDLHDSVKQTLFSVGLGLHAAHSMLGRNPDMAARAVLAQEELVVRAQRELGELLVQLRTPAEDRADLTAALAACASQIARQHGLAMVTRLDQAPLLPSAHVHELRQIVREALHNTAKHSGATSALLWLEAEPHGITITVADEGCGFDPQLAGRATMGLRGMRERAAMVGAALGVASSPGKGTRIIISLRRAV